ncbi:GTP binding 7 isoform 2 family protein [Babesia ovata]|uniref:GTP binding 7 isoform 2 family protein n=1 Tax=Babesia ovata TaxID=189622 RepID=A0A2H6KDM5_9APIC|nr:GTP binding 7 isoform 2 family protein [Babesia ovata]GBE61098.1 GTP binding 7 isoform 2 family protein [Babesia ovata]
MDIVKRYRQRVGRPSGPSLDDFIYRRPPPTYDHSAAVFYNPTSSSASSATSSSAPFTPREKFTFDRSITWFPAHMASAKLNIGKKRRAVDCILEVRDARAPLTASNCTIIEEYPEHVPRLVVLNKSDLVPPNDMQRAVQLLENTGKKVVLYSALGLRKITKITNFVREHVAPQFKTLGVWMMVVGLPNVGKSSIINALKRYSFTQRWHSKYGMQQPTSLTTAKAKSAGVAGSTRSLSAFFVSEKPKLYCFDTPGVMLPKMQCPEINLKLAAIGCVDDHSAGVDYIADYILYTLNRKKMFDYVEVLGLPGPTDDVKEVMEHISRIAERKYSTIEPANCYRIFINQFRRGSFGLICLDDLNDIMRRGDLSDFELRSSGIHHTELSRPPEWPDGSVKNSSLSHGSRKWSCSASTRRAHGKAAESQKQYVEDDIVYTEFAPLHSSASGPSQYDLALQDAAKYFEEVDCSGGRDSSPRSRVGATTIPYDEMQLAFFQGDEVVDEVLSNTQEVLNIACDHVVQFHNSRVYTGSGEESNRNSAAALRSVRCLVYWIGGRILNCAKQAMDRLDRNSNASASETEHIRRIIEKRIRRFAHETVHHWESAIGLKEVDLGVPTLPNIRQSRSPEEHVARLWNYLNVAAFGGVLPEFVDINFSWYDLVNSDGSVIPSENGELFRYTQKDNIAFPGIAYPRELADREAALGNCIFRSMMKLHCDIYGTKLGGDNYATVALSACQFVESEAARAARLGFSCVQSDVVASDANLRHLLPHLNSYDPLRNTDAEVNDSDELYVGIDRLPFITNRLKFAHLKEVVKDLETSLDIFDRSFRPRGQVPRDMVTDEVKRIATDIALSKGVSGATGVVSPPDGDKSLSNAVEGSENGTSDEKGEDASGGTRPTDEWADDLDAIWSRDQEGNLILPIEELQRSLIFGDLEKFGNLLSLGMNDLVKLKPVQLNSIQNKIVAICLDALNYIRSVDTYAINYSLAPEDLAREKPTGLVHQANMGVIQCILFLYKLVGRCLTHSGLFPLDNAFLRTRPLELLVREANPPSAGGAQRVAADPAKFGEETLHQEQKMKPVPFPQEYINEAVAADDPAALKFLVNYYNFNLFGGRLPIDLEVVFEHTAVDDYLSSHDDSADILKAPRILLNPLARSSKPLVARLILEECYHLFLRFAYRYSSGFEGRSDVLLTEVMASDLAHRTRRHIANCIEGSGDWPFFFDDMHYMAVQEHPELEEIGNTKLTLRDRTLNDVFKDLLNTQEDVIRTLELLVKRPMMTDMWERQVLPIRHFVNALHGGNYDLIYTILVNPSSVAAISPLPIGTINAIENKFKDACHIAHSLDNRRGQIMGESEQHIEALTNLESLKIVECAFDELREHATKHSLIVASDLTQGITAATNNLARCQPEEVDHTKSDVDCTVINLNSAGFPEVVSRVSNDDKVVNKYIQPSNVDATTSSEDGKGSSTPSSNGGVMHPDTKVDGEAAAKRYHLNDEEKVAFAEAAYRSYNRRLFNDVLPADMRIQFADIEELSALEDSAHRIEPPTIKLNNMLDDARLIFLQLITQMVNIGFTCSTHNIEMDCLRYFGASYRSAFKQLHVNQQQLIRSRLLPISREARLKAKEKSKDGVNKKYLKSLKEAALLDSDGGKTNSLLDMEIDEFVDEVLDGREKVQRLNHEATLCNPFEEYQALKSFARHFINWKQTKTSFEEAAALDVNASKPVMDGGESVLPIVNNHVIRNIWARFKFEHLEKVLKKSGIEMPLSAPLDLNWQQLLNEEQQFKMMKYLSLSAENGDTVFTMLVRSGACSPTEAYAFLIKLADPHLKLEPYPTVDSSDMAGTSRTPGAAAGVGENAAADSLGDDESEEVDPFDNEHFSGELQALMRTMDLPTAETINLLVDKLVHRNYADAMGILSTHPKRSYLKEMAIKFLDVIRNNGVLDERHHIEILEFLRN